MLKRTFRRKKISGENGLCTIFKITVRVCFMLILDLVSVLEQKTVEYKTGFPWFWKYRSTGRNVLATIIYFLLGSFGKVNLTYIKNPRSGFFQPLSDTPVEF